MPIADSGAGVERETSQESVGSLMQRAMVDYSYRQKQRRRTRVDWRACGVGESPSASTSSLLMASTTRRPRPWATQSPVTPGHPSAFVHHGARTAVLASLPSPPCRSRSLRGGLRSVRSVRHCRPFDSASRVLYRLRGVAAHAPTLGHASEEQNKNYRTRCPLALDYSCVPSTMLGMSLLVPSYIPHPHIPPQCCVWDHRSLRRRFHRQQSPPTLQKAPLAPSAF